MRAMRSLSATILVGLVAAGCAVRSLPTMPATTTSDAPPAGLPNGVAAAM